MNDNADNDPRLHAIPDIHGHAKGEHKAFTDERPIPLSARMLFLWFFHACRRGWPRFLMVTDHMNYLTFEDPAAINLVRRALKLAQAGDLYGAAETASVEVGHAAVVSEGLRRGMRYSIGAEVDNDPRSRPDAQNIVDAMKPDGMIRSIHFLTIDHPVHGPNWNWPFDNPEFADVFEIVGAAKTWELYMATLLDAVERLPGNIVGHFYVPAIFGHWPDDATLETYEDQIVDACEARGMALEVNTRFLYRDHSDEQKAKYLAAHRRLLAKCKAKNVGIAIGSDAHSPKDQGRGFAAVLALLDECEINELVFPIGGRLLRVALRVERKAEPVAEAAPGVSAEERKALRKPRTSEAPARPKETSSKREESSATDAAPTPPDEPAAAKPKPRPKRSKNRAAPSADGPVDERLDAATDEFTPAAVEAPAAETPAAEVALGQVAVDGEPSAGDATPTVDEPPTSTASHGALDESTPDESAPDAGALDEAATVATEYSAPAAPPADPPMLPVDVADVASPDTGAEKPSQAAPAKPPRARSKASPSGAKAGAAATKSKTAVKSAGKPPVKAGGKKAAPKHGASAKSAAKSAPVAAKKSPAKKVASKAPARAAAAKKSAVKGTTTKKASAKKPAPKRR